MSTLQIQLVKKTAIIESGDFNLSAARYLEKVEINSVYEVVSIIDTFQLVKQSNKIKKNNYLKEGMIPIIDQSSDFIAGYTNDENGVIDEVCPLIIFGDHTRVVKFINFKFLPGADGVKILKPNIDMILPKFLYNILKSIKLKNLGYSRHFKLLKEVMIPLPPLEIQEQIVKEIEGYQQIIDGCRKVVENYKPVIDIDPTWEVVELGKVIHFIDYIANGSFAALKENVTYKNEEDYALLVRLTDLRKDLLNNDKKYVNEHSYNFLKKSFLEGGELLFANVGANVGTVYIMPRISQKATLGPNMFLIKFNEKIDNKYAYYTFKGNFVRDQVFTKSISAAQPKINKSELRSIEIPVPSKDKQIQIVEKLEQEREVIEGNKELIKIYEKKINDKIKELF